MKKVEEGSFINDLISEECDRDPIFRRAYEADKLAEQLKKARISNHIALRAVAEVMNTAQPSVSRLENHLESASVGRLLDYLGAIGYKIELKRSSRAPMAKQDAERQPRSKSLGAHERKAS